MGLLPTGLTKNKKKNKINTKTKLKSIRGVKKWISFQIATWNITRLVDFWNSGFSWRFCFKGNEEKETRHIDSDYLTARTVFRHYYRLGVTRRPQITWPLLPCSWYWFPFKTSPLDLKNFPQKRLLQNENDRALSKIELPACYLQSNYLITTFMPVQ